MHAGKLTASRISGGAGRGSGNSEDQSQPPLDQYNPCAEPTKCLNTAAQRQPEMEGAGLEIVLDHMQREGQPGGVPTSPTAEELCGQPQPRGGGWREGDEGETLGSQALAHVDG